MRGLDYYSHTAFEITSSQLGAQATVCGGGRYDGLVEQLGGAPTQAIGWALGMERLVLLLAQVEGAAAPVPEIYVVSRGEQAEAEALGLARQLRLQGRAVELDLSAAAFGKQLKRADRSGAAWAVLIGDSEAEQGEVILKALRGPATAADQRASAAAAADQPASAVTAASVPEQEPVAERRLPQQELLRQFA